MSMLDSFFKQAFKASKCKTLLKLTIPRIKLLRNRREIQLKKMRHDIAKLLETGQEATARIRVEHIIREENMMATQEIVELFCELITVRLPIIESQRECPLDLKEAISSVCFAAPRCSDLPELLQVQLLFASKYGKEFVSAATELMPDCGVNRQLIELLSVRAPLPEKKLKLLKNIAVEHELDWDPSASETEFLKNHEDLLDGPTKFVSGSKLLLPEEKYNEALYSSPDHPNKEQLDFDSGSDTLEFPEVPKVSVWPCSNIAAAPKMVIPPATPPSELDLHSPSHSRFTADVKQEQVEERSMVEKDELHASSEHMENKQYVPFMSPPSVSSRSPFAKEIGSPPSLSKTNSEAYVDLQDVLATAHAAAETAERAAAAARSAASLAQERISELTKKNRDRLPDSSCENPFYTDTASQSEPRESEHVTEQIPTGNSDVVLNHFKSYQDHDSPQRSDSSSFPSFDTLKADFDSSLPNGHVLDNKSFDHQPKRLPSMDDDSYFPYPNLFTSQNSNVGSQTNIGSTHDL